jgi:hypothetical protein
MFFLFIILATAGVAAAAPKTATTATQASLADDPPFIVAVVFENGLNTINVNAGDNFTVSINVTDAPAVDFMSIKVHWDPSVMNLKDNNTDLDVLTGGFFDTFWGPSFAGTHLATGTLDDVTGFDNVGSSSGNGAVFTMAFHARVLSSGVNITIVTPNLDSYFMMGTTQQNITSAVDGSVIVIPEFSASVLLPLFLGATTVAIAAATVSSRKRRIPNSIS